MKTRFRRRSRVPGEPPGTRDSGALCRAPRGNRASVFRESENSADRRTDLRVSWYGQVAAALRGPLPGEDDSGRIEPFRRASHPQPHCAMTCQEFRAQLHEYLDETHEAGSALAAGEHFAQCPECRLAVQREQRLGRTLRHALERATADVSLSPSSGESDQESCDPGGVKAPFLKPSSGFGQTLPRVNAKKLESENPGKANKNAAANNKA